MKNKDNDGVQNTVDALMQINVAIRISKNL